MILEADDENREFVTVYKEHYYPKRVGRVPKCIHPANYRSPLNPLNGPVHDHLNSLRRNEKVSPEKRSEDVRSEYRHLHKLLPDVRLDEKVVESEKKAALKTIYQLEYSRHGDDYLSSHAGCTAGYRSTVTLPYNWIIPETIYKASYRNPYDSKNPADDARARKIVKPANNLDPNEKERDILRIATGNSEYVDVIGATARRIFKEQLHNSVLIPLEAPFTAPLSHCQVKGPDNVTSKCSDDL